MTCPDFCSMNVGSTAATPFRTPLMFTSTIWCQSWVFSAERCEFGMRPAFRKMTSTPPNVRAEFDDGVVLGRLGHVQCLVDRLAAVLLDLVGDLLELVF